MKTLSRTLRNFGALMVVCLPLLAARPEIGLLEGQFAEVLRSYGANGGVLVVAQDGELLTEARFGTIRQVNERLPIASCTKLITALATLRFVDHGRLDLDRPVWELLPEIEVAALDPRWRRVTVRHLLQHEGGWERSRGEIGGKTANTVLRSITQQPLDYEPGSRRVYSNFGALLLTAVLERISGLGYAQIIEREVLGPLQMAETGMGTTRRLAAWSGAAGVVGSMPDLIRLVEGAEALLSPSSRQVWRQVGFATATGAWSQPGYLEGLGRTWVYRDEQGLSIAWHVQGQELGEEFEMAARSTVLHSLGSQAIPSLEPTGEGEGAGIRRNRRPAQMKAPVYDPKKHRARVYKKPKLRR